MESPRALRDKAARYRHLSRFVSDPQAFKALFDLAECYEALAAELEHAACQGAGSQPPSASEWPRCIG